VSILAQNHPGRGLNIINFDDGHGSVYALAFPVMQRYKLRGQIAVVPDLVGTPGMMTVAQLKDLYDNYGWIMVGHGKDHTDFAGRTRVAQAADMQYCHDWLEGNGMPRGAHHMVWPHGSYDANTLLAMNDVGIVTGRHTVLAACSGHVADPRQLGCRYVIDQSDSISGGSFYSYAASAVGGSSMWYFCFHQFNTVAAGGESCLIDHFEAFARYCYEADLECCLVDEWFANQSGPYTLPDDLTRGLAAGHPPGMFFPTKYGAAWAKGPYVGVV
jgi:hypothetical protein